MKRKYTVIGLYADNQQPWMTHSTGDTPAHAARNGMLSLVRGSDKADPDNLFVVEVIKGWRKGTLCNDSTLSYQDVEARINPPDPCQSCRKNGETTCGNDTKAHSCYEGKV